MTYEHLRTLAVTSLRSAMEVAEEQTDAGTRFPAHDEPDPDAAYDRLREKEDGDA